MRTARPGERAFVFRLRQPAAIGFRDDSLCGTNYLDGTTVSPELAPAETLHLGSPQLGPQLLLSCIRAECDRSNRQLAGFATDPPSLTESARSRRARLNYRVRHHGDLDQSGHFMPRPPARRPYKASCSSGSLRFLRGN